VSYNNIKRRIEKGVSHCAEEAVRARSPIAARTFIAFRLLSGFPPTLPVPRGTVHCFYNKVVVVVFGPADDDRVLPRGDGSAGGGGGRRRRH
jgi:hypothetical protein